MPARKRSSVPVVCECPRVRHAHGEYTSYASCGCGCPPCMDAARRYRTESRIRLAREGSTFVPIGPVQEHIAVLRGHGIGTRRLADLSGVQARLIQAIVAGSRGPRDGELRTVRRASAEAILAVAPAAGLVAPQRQIDATGTRRRMQALAAMGWCRAELARRGGFTPTTAGRLMVAEWCSLSSARRVHALYEELWDQAPPSATRAERAAVSRILHEAAQQQWAPPASWDDELIDDPGAAPAGLDLEGTDVVGRLDELVFLAGTGEDLDRAARRLGWGSWEAARHRATQRGHRAARLRAEASEVAA